MPKESAEGEGRGDGRCSLWGPRGVSCCPLGPKTGVWSQTRQGDRRTREPNIQIRNGRLSAVGELTEISWLNFRLDFCHVELSRRLNNKTDRE